MHFISSISKRSDLSRGGAFKCVDLGELTGLAMIGSSTLANVGLVSYQVVFNGAEPNFHIQSYKRLQLSQVPP